MKNSYNHWCILLPLLIAALGLKAQPAFKMMVPLQMQQELSIIKNTLTSLHPGIYRYETPAQIDAVFKLYGEKMKRPQPENHYLILIAQLLTNVHCGHTYTNYWNQPATVKDSLYSKTCLPILYRMLGKKMIVTHNLSNNQLIRQGDRVIAINGLSVSRIIDSLLTVSSSDGLHGLARNLDNISIEPLDAAMDNYNLTDIYLPLFFPSNFNVSAYRLTLQHSGSKKLFTVQVAAADKASRLAVYQQRFGQLAVHEQNWKLKIINKQTACFAIGDFETWEWKKDYRKFLDSIFTELGNKHVANLIVDIRGNGGGDDEARDEVFSYLSSQPFGCADPMQKRIRFLAIPDTLLPYLKTWDKTFKQPGNSADYHRTKDGFFENIKDAEVPCIPIQPKANHFRGKLFLLTDNRNSSTTFTLAKLFKTLRNGKIIGEPTAGNQQGINGGQFFFLNLPYSKIEADIPLVWGAYHGVHPDTGISPDYFIPTTRQNISEKKDAQLSFVLTLIGKQ